MENITVDAVALTTESVDLSELETMEEAFAYGGSSAS